MSQKWDINLYSLLFGMALNLQHAVLDGLLAPWYSHSDVPALVVASINAIKTKLWLLIESMSDYSSCYNCCCFVAVLASHRWPAQYLSEPRGSARAQAQCCVGVTFLAIASNLQEWLHKRLRDMLREHPFFGSLAPSPLNGR